MTQQPRESDARLGWDGGPIPQRFRDLWESCDIAGSELRGLAEADRAFGGDGDVAGMDAASRLARDYLFLVSEMQALGESIIALVERPGDLSVERRLRTIARTGRAILDHLPDRHAAIAFEGNVQQERGDGPA